MGLIVRIPIQFPFIGYFILILKDLNHRGSSNNISNEYSTYFFKSPPLKSASNFSAIVMGIIGYQI